MSIFTLSGTDRQQAIVQEAIDRCTFPWDLLAPGLRENVGKEAIPVEWADLSRYNTITDAEGHKHVHINGDTAHVLEARERVLGLAWYSGKVSLELSMEANPTLAMEVFLSEAAHMVDFFYLSDEQRARIFALYHGWDPFDPTSWEGDHGHGWFDVGTYSEWIGESFMGGFVNAFSDLPVTIPFTHELRDPTELRMLRQVVLRRTSVVFGTKRSRVYHDEHERVRRDVEWSSPEAAQADGRRPCKTCKPG